ncbi:hypothetical protein AB7B51_17570 [Acinetobacter baumannii]|uniref:hypothetical protein n=1 Tax=Acinetobacter baumannii TaxID=470 RepID=UPI0034E1D2F1
MTLNELLFLGLVMLGFVTAGISLWGIGRFLRKKGRGPQLDQIGAKISNFQNSTTRRVFSPLGSYFLNALQNIHKSPLFGNKRLQNIQHKPQADQKDNSAK